MVIKEFRSSPADSGFARLRTGLTALAVGVGISACSTNSVPIAGSFPSPMMEPLPLNVGLYIDPEMVDFSHREEIPNNITYVVEIGAIQPDLFRNTFTSMFRNLRTVDGTQVDDPTIDAILAPNLDEFQFTIPLQTQSEFYEVWLKYKIELYTPDGQVIAVWPVTAYGKSPDRFNVDAAINEAAMIAMRDASATIAIRFKNQPDIRQWLLQQDDVIPAIPPTVKVREVQK